MKTIGLRIIRRMSGLLFLLFAAVPCVYTILNLCYVYSTYAVYWGGTEVTFSGEPDFHSIGIDLSIILWCIQFALPGIVLGLFMIRREWQSKNWRKWICLALAAVLGIYLMSVCACYQYEFVNMLLSGDDSQKEIDSWPVLCSGMSWYPQYIFILINTAVMGYLSYMRMNASLRQNGKTDIMQCVIVVGIILFTVLGFANTQFWLMKYVGY